MIDLRLHIIEVKLEGKRYELILRKHFGGIEIFRVSEIVPGSDSKLGYATNSIDFSYVEKTPFTFRNVCWALCYNLRKFFKLLFTKRSKL